MIRQKLNSDFIIIQKKSFCNNRKCKKCLHPKVPVKEDMRAVAKVARFKFELEIGVEVGYTVLGEGSLFLVPSSADM